MAERIAQKRKSVSTPTLVAILGSVVMVGSAIADNTVSGIAWNEADRTISDHQNSLSSLFDEFDVNSALASETVRISASDTPDQIFSEFNSSLEYIKKDILRQRLYSKVKSSMGYSLDLNVGPGKIGPLGTIGGAALVVLGLKRRNRK